MAAADTALARCPGVATAVVIGLRSSIKEGDHFTRHPCGKIDFPTSGVEAIRASLPEKKEGATAA